jgi:hypothetical protein
MLPCYERTVRISRDKYLSSRNRGIQVPKEPTTIGGHLGRRRLQLKIFQPEAALAERRALHSKLRSEGYLLLSFVRYADRRASRG